MSAPRLVIFDFDGTLADSFPWFISVFNDVAEKYGFRRVDPSELDLLRTYSGRRLVKHLGIRIWKLPLIASYGRKLMTRDIDKVRTFPGVPELLRALRDAGRVLAVVSSNSEENVRRVLGPETAALIRYYECGASIFGKRSRFRRVLRRSGIPASESLYIGDEIRDGESARAAGIPFGAVSWGYTRPESLESQGPALMFERVEEIGERLGVYSR